jgi:cobalt-precorrin-7 (C5)-methyltransferase
VSEEYDLDAGPDPAALAAARSEPALGLDSPAGDLASQATDVVHAVGIGPGNPDYLTPRARTAIRSADVVVGFETVVDFVADAVTGDALRCGYADEAATLEEFAARVDDGDAGTAVLMGDPNHSGYQFVGKVQAAVDAPVRVVPGISALQVAASRARTPIEASTFVTLHKSGDLDADLDRLRAAVGERHLLVLPRPYDLMPGDVAADLLDHGADADLDALVLERLTHEDEAVTRTTLGALADHAGGDGADATPFSDLSVLVVRAGDART